MAHGNELNSKKYYWLKLDRHFFNNARIKKLRKLAGGDTFTIIYLKLMLMSIEQNGVLVYEGIEDTFEKEMALKIEEDDENVSITIKYLISQGLMFDKGEDFELIEAKNSIGSETYNNIYKRNKVVGKILTTFQPTSNQIPIEKEIELDIEIEKEKEIYKEKELKDLKTLAPSYFKKNTSTPLESEKNGEMKLENKDEKDFQYPSSTQNPPSTEVKPCIKKVEVIPAIELILNDQSLYAVTEQQVHDWQDIYPAVDVMQELRKMKGWLMANVKNRKTKTGINRFINTWLSRAQDKAPKQTEYKSYEQVCNEVPSELMTPKKDDELYADFLDAIGCTQEEIDERINKHG